MLLVAFTDKGFISMPFDGASLRWFRAILENDDIVAAFWLSARLALAAATIGCVLAVPAALAIARYRFPGRAALTGFFLSPMMIPAVVLGIAFLRFLSLLDLGGSFWSLVATHVVIVLPYALRLTLSSAVGARSAMPNARHFAVARAVHRVSPRRAADDPAPAWRAAGCSRSFTASTS